MAPKQAVILISTILLLSSCGQKNEVDFIYDAYKNGEYKDILSKETQLEKTYSENAFFWYYKGLCHLKEEHFVQAKQDFLVARKLKFKYAGLANFGLCVANLNLGDENTAYNYFQIALDDGLDYRYIEHKYLDKFKSTPDFIGFKEKNRPSFNFWTSCIFFLGIQGILLTFYLFFKKSPNKRKNMYLGLLTIAYCMLILSYALMLSRFDYYLPLVDDDFFHVILYSLGPLGFLYLKSVLGECISTIQLGKHFLPFLVALLFISFSYLNLVPFKLYSIAVDPYPMLAHLSLYGMANYILYKKHSDKLNGMTKTWLIYLFTAYTLFTLLNISYFVLIEFSLYGIYLDILLIVSMCSFLVLLGVAGYVQPKIFWGSSVKDVITSLKYSRSGLSPKLSKEIKQKLLTLIEEEELYLKTDLTLDYLADRLGIKRHYVSQIINEHFKMGFYDFVNRFRVREAITILEKDDDLRVIEVVYQTGFNNKVSFYKAFKKITGLTPKEYQEQNLMALVNGKSASDF